MNPLGNLLDLLFPPFCCHCQKVGSWLCLKCQDQIQFLTCPKIVLPPESPLNEVWVMAAYQGPMRSLVKALKFGHFRAGGRLLAELIDWSLLLPTTQLITYVPLHSRRKSERGYDQAEQIASNLSALLKVPSQNLLKRTIYLDPQSGVKDKAERLSRLEKCFRINPALQKKLAELSPTTTLDLLLIDDVYTTGATLHQAALALRRIPQIRKVIGLCVAH